MHKHPTNSNWLEIDLDVMARNIGVLRNVVGVPLMAVVKANGYGHGILETARCATAAGASYCGVARVDEALELRQGGITSPILVLGHTPENRFEEAIRADISLTLFDNDQTASLKAISDALHHKARIHIKVETGMSRLGASPLQARALLKVCSAMEYVIVEGIFTHYARADEAQVDTTEKQERIFLDLLEDLTAEGLRPQIAHTANSAAALIRPSARLDMVRMGISIYGMPPAPNVELPEGVKPALSWKAQLTAIHDLPAGTGVSYGHAYFTTNKERIGVVPVGYGDGYRRTEGSTVLVCGQRAPIVGRVCMDQLMINLDNIPAASIGDEVVLIGRQDDRMIHASDLALTWNTINYEVTCGLSARVPRIYFPA
jgi:alanine racemase